MMSKLYLGLLAISALLVGFFTWYSWSWLQSIGLPAAAVDGFKYNDGIAWTLLIASSLILLIFANVYLWYTRRAWPLWTTFLYFSVFILIRYFLIIPQYREFHIDNGMESGFKLGHLFGAILVIAAAIFTFCDQFAILQLHRTMYPAAAVPEPQDPDIEGS